MDRLAVAALILVAAVLAAACYRARRTAAIERVEPSDFGLADHGRAVAGFTSPMCHACEAWRRELDAHGVEATFVDVKDRPDLARRYRVHTTPTVLLVDLPGGRVLRQFRDDPEPGTVAELRDAVLT